jgi:hypothetical protein
MGRFAFTAGSGSGMRRNTYTRRTDHWWLPVRKSFHATLLNVWNKSKQWVWCMIICLTISNQGKGGGKLMRQQDARRQRMNDNTDHQFFVKMKHSDRRSRDCSISAVLLYRNVAPFSTMMMSEEREGIGENGLASARLELYPYIGETMQGRTTDDHEKIALVSLTANPRNSRLGMTRDRRSI